MAKITKITNTHAKTILSQYTHFSRETFESFISLSGGTVNTLYKIKFTKQNLYLKVDELGNLKRLSQEMSLLEHLHAQRFPYQLPKPLEKSNGALFTPYQNKFIYLLTEVKGVEIDPQIWQTKHAAQLAQALARLHSIKPHSNAQLHKWNLKTLQSTLLSLKSNFSKMDQQFFLTLRRILKELRAHPKQKSPQHIIHADAFFDNLHWQNNKLTGILDFEYAGLGNPLYDIALALLANAWSKNMLNTQLARAFLRAYQKIHSLKKHSLQDWRHAFAHAAITIVITRLKTFEFGPLKGKKKSYRDYREFLTRYEWSQSAEFDNFFELTIL